MQNVAEQKGTNRLDSAGQSKSTEGIMGHTMGYIGATLTTLAFVPQVIKLYKERSARSISLKTFYMFSVGILFWLLYGIQIHSMPMILANSITLVLSVSILVMKHMYKEQ